jgi:hypothetical protein
MRSAVLLARLVLIAAVRVARLAQQATRFTSAEQAARVEQQAQ